MVSKAWVPTGYAYFRPTILKLVDVALDEKESSLKRFPLFFAGGIVLAFFPPAWRERVLFKSKNKVTEAIAENLGGYIYGNLQLSIEATKRKRASTEN